MNSLHHLLFRCTFNILFLFNGTLYRKREGAPMGPALGLLLLDAFLVKTEITELKSAVNTFAPITAVGDIFCAIGATREQDCVPM